MKTRTCTKCGSTKHISGFRVQRKLSGPEAGACRPRRVCKGCETLDQLHRLRTDPSTDAYHRLNKARNSTRNGELIRKAKNVPCADCGKRYPFYVMDFDHVRGSKRKKLSKMRSFGPDTVLAEIAKCDAVCANCHREREYTRGSHHKMVIPKDVTKTKDQLKLEAANNEQ